VVTIREGAEGLHGAFLGVMDGIIHALSIVSGLQILGDKAIVFVGLSVAGLADALANAVGFHVQEESEKFHSQAEVWKGTLLCFLATGLAFMLMAVPILILSMEMAVFLDWCISIVLFTVLGLSVDREREFGHRVKRVLEYITMGTVTALLCYWIGSMAKAIFEGHQLP